MEKKKPKVCFAASSGGHLDELLMLRPLMEQYESFLVTEKTAFKRTEPGIMRYELLQVNRLEKTCIPRLILNGIYSLKIYLKERPDAVISTGVLAMIPLCLVCKAFGKKLIYIESFAKVKSPTRTGMMLYRFADRFYVQWPQMLECYPRAIYRGGIY